MYLTYYVYNIFIYIIYIYKMQSAGILTISLHLKTSVTFLSSNTPTLFSDTLVYWTLVHLVLNAKPCSSPT